MAKYLFAVQRESGHEVVSAFFEPEKVSDVKATRGEDGHVTLELGDEKVVSEQTVEADEVLKLHRWDADDKLAEPVTHPVK